MAKIVLHKRITLSHMLDTLTKLFQRAKHVDFTRLCVCVSKAKTLENAALCNDSREVHRLLRAMKPWVPVRNLRLLAPDNMPAHDFLQERQIVAAFFQVILESEEVSSADLVEEDRAALVDHAIQH